MTSSVNLIMMGACVVPAGACTFDWWCRKVQPLGLGLGDVDCNGRINTLDAFWVLLYDAQVIGAVPCPEAADANKDGHIDALDALLMVQVDAGLIDGIPKPAVTGIQRIRELFNLW